ncbi:hypothetical protein [Streptomyces hydrogenans]
MTTASAALPRTGGSPGGGAPRRTPAPAPGPDERIAHVVAEALGSARTVLDSDSLPGLGGDRLPFGDQSFDAATMLCNAPRVPDALTRLRELRRVTRGPVVVLAVDPSRVRGF